MKNYIAKGDTIEVTAGAATVAGQAMAVGDLVAVAIDAIANAAVGQARLAGAYELPKKTADVLAQGDICYYDATLNEITLTSAGNNKAGHAYAAADGTVSLVIVILGS